jgi:hypothetical protein
LLKTTTNTSTTAAKIWEPTVPKNDKIDDDDDDVVLEEEIEYEEDLVSNSSSSWTNTTKTTTTTSTNIDLTLFTVTNDKRYRHQLRSDWPIIYQKIPSPYSVSWNRTFSICFVHVGKSAGSTVSCVLGFLHGRCQNATHPTQWIVPPALDSPIAQSVTHMIHNDYNDCIPKTQQQRDQEEDDNDDEEWNNEQTSSPPRPKEYAYYMFAIRDPIQRMISWFNYESPRNTKTTYRHWEKVQALYLDCQFDTLNDLGEYIGTMEDVPNMTHYLDMMDDPPPEKHDEKDNEKDEDESEISLPRPPICRKRAILAVTGRKRFVFHNYYNYGYYYHQVTRYSERNNYRHNQSNNNKRNYYYEQFWKLQKILVLRSEHLQDDWESIEQGLERGRFGTTNNDNTTTSTSAMSSAFFTTNRSPKRDDRDQYLSPLALKNLCFWLCWEIQIYKKLIRNAVNLNEHDKQTSIQELAQSCPIQAASNESVCFDDVALFETKKKKKNKKPDQRQENEKNNQKMAKTKKPNGTKGSG